MPALVELLGAERVCFGSDYPHAEGLAEPLSWLGEVAELDARAVERIVSANMYELLGIERRRPAAAAG